MDKDRNIIFIAICISIIIYYFYYKNKKEFKELEKIIFLVYLGTDNSCNMDESKFDGSESESKFDGSESESKFDGSESESKFVFAGYDIYKYPIWVNDGNNDIKIFFISSGCAKEIGIDKRYIWSWVIYESDIIYYSHTKCSMTPYDERMVWNDNINLIIHKPI